MDDLISRQSVLDAFGLSEKTRKYGGDHSGYNTMMLYEVQEIIEGLPSIGREKTGRWIEGDITFCEVDFIDYKCDKCGEIVDTCRKGLKPDKLPNYCPNCGCRMEVENDR